MGSRVVTRNILCHNSVLLWHRMYLCAWNFECFILIVICELVVTGDFCMWVLNVYLWRFPTVKNYRLFCIKERRYGFSPPFHSCCSMFYENPCTLTGTKMYSNFDIYNKQLFASNYWQIHLFYPYFIVFLDILFLFPVL